MCGRYGRTTAEEELPRWYHVPIPPQSDLSQLEHCSARGCRWRSRSIQNPSNAPWMFELRIDAILSRRSQDRVQDDQCGGVETVDTAPSFRQGLKKQRCLIPVDGLKGWRRVGSASCSGLEPGSSDRFPNPQINNALTQSRATLGFFTCL
jgi:putative SOS response-associated peptidase YedK